MADEKAPGAPESVPRRKREAPTIDLTAQDVTPPSGTPNPPGAAGETANASSNNEANSTSPADAGTNSPPPPPPEEPAFAEALPAHEPPIIARPRGSWLGQVVAGVAGGAIVAAVLGALWYSGTLPVRNVTSGEEDSQLAALQQQVEALQNRAAPAASDTKVVDALNQRVAAMENALKTLPKSDGSVAERLAAAENSMKSLGVALAALNQRSDDAAANAARAREQADAAEKAVTQLRGNVQDVAKDASAAVTPAQVDALTQRLTALEQSGKAARDELNKTVAGEKAARLALSASSLRAAIMSGAPYAAELAQAKALGADDKYVAPLTPFASSGVPTATALAQELHALLPQMLKISGTVPTGSFLDRLQANAGRLVRVTPVDAPRGDDPAAVLARLEVESAHADITGALADLAKLPDATRAPAQAWIAKAKAREAALAAARDFANDAARALGAR